MHSTQIDLVDIPAGEFEMGSTIQEVDRNVECWRSKLLDPSYEASFRDWLIKEVPKHRVSVEAFRMSRFPITNSLYRLFLSGSYGGNVPESICENEPDDHPVWGVSYEDAEACAQWLGQRVGMTFDLPSEIEWERAARGTSAHQYPFGSEFDSEKCNTIEAAIGRTTPVDRYLQGASEFGIVDLAGNVEEWTSTFYQPYPGGRFIQDDLSVLSGGSYRILRGGSFALGGDLARCARRHGPHPHPRFRFRGFRIVVRERR